MGGVGHDRGAAGEVARDGLPRGEGDVGGEAQPEDPLGGLAPAVAPVVVRVARVAAGGDEPVRPAAWLRRRGGRGGRRRRRAAGPGGKPRRGRRGGRSGSPFAAGRWGSRALIRSSFPDPSGVPHSGFARQILPLCARNTTGTAWPWRDDRQGSFEYEILLFSNSVLFYWEKN